MSSIKIECKKNIATQESEKNRQGYEDVKDIGRNDNELVISVHQYFLDTKDFFNTVKESLKDYFDKIEEKK